MKTRGSLEWIAFAASSAVILYAGFAAFDFVFDAGFDKCVNAREAPVVNERGVLAEAMARWCAFTGMPNETRLGLHLSGEAGDFVLVYYEPQNNRDAPVLRWVDAENLSVDLGEVTWLTPPIGHLGRVKITYSYSGADPSLE
ncbi:MAG: hypothetical protein ACRECP_06495 [Methylocella sp.]